MVRRAKSSAPPACAGWRVGRCGRAAHSHDWHVVCGGPVVIGQHAKGMPPSQMHCLVLRSWEVVWRWRANHVDHLAVVVHKLKLAVATRQELTDTNPHIQQQVSSALQHISSLTPLTAPAQPNQAPPMAPPTPHTTISRRNNRHRLPARTLRCNHILHN